MAAELSLGEQLAAMLTAMRLHETELSRNNDLSFLTMIWPLLPLLPPEPPALVSELFRRKETCDVCGLEAQGRPLHACSGSDSHLTPAQPSTGVRRRHAPSTAEQTTSLEKIMADVERKMEDTLNSIENTTNKTSELNRKTKELEHSGKSLMTDVELLKRLKTLVSEKEKQENKVKVLEVKEQHLKETLVTAINWARNMNTSQEMPEGIITPQDNEDADPNNTTVATN